VTKSISASSLFSFKEISSKAGWISGRFREGVRKLWDIAQKPLKMELSKTSANQTEFTKAIKEQKSFLRDINFRRVVLSKGNTVWIPPANYYKNRSALRTCVCEASFLLFGILRVEEIKLGCLLETGFFIEIGRYSFPYSLAFFAT